MDPAHNCQLRVILIKINNTNDYLASIISSQIEFVSRGVLANMLNTK
jgi:hypothetical protein